MSDADCTPGREPRSVAASAHLKIKKLNTLFRCHLNPEFCHLTGELSVDTLMQQDTVDWCHSDFSCFLAWRLHRSLHLGVPTPVW